MLFPAGVDVAEKRHRPAASFLNALLPCPWALSSPSPLPVSSSLMSAAAANTLSMSMPLRETTNTFGLPPQELGRPQQHRKRLNSGLKASHRPPPLALVPPSPLSTMSSMNNVKNKTATDLASMRKWPATCTIFLGNVTVNTDCTNHNTVSVPFRFRCSRRRWLTCGILRHVWME